MTTLILHTVTGESTHEFASVEEAIAYLNGMLDLDWVAEVDGKRYHPEHDGPRGWDRLVEEVC